MWIDIKRLSSIDVKSREVALIVQTLSINERFS